MGRTQRGVIVALVAVVALALGWALVSDREGDARSTAPSATREVAVVRSTIDMTAPSAPSPAPVATVSGSKIIHVTGRVGVRAFPREGSESGPLAGVDVVATRTGEGEVLATTNGAGGFALALSPGPWTISLRPLMSIDVRTLEAEAAAIDDRGWPEPAHDAPREARIDLVGDRPVTLDVRVRSEGLIAGRVVDDVTGAPIAGATISLGATPDQEVSSAITDAQGRFFVVSDRRESMTTLPSRVLLARAHGYAPGAAFTPDTSPIVGAMTDLELRLLRPVTLVGRVVDLEGRPVPGVDVQVAAPLRSHPVVVPGQGRTQGASSAWEWRITTGPDGAFVVEDLPPSVSPTHTHVRVDARRAGWKQVAPCEGLAGPGAAPLTVVIAPEVALVGVVVDASGAPIERASIARLGGWPGVRFNDDDDAGALQDRVTHNLRGTAEPLRSLDIVVLRTTTSQRVSSAIPREQQSATWTSPQLEPGPIEVRVDARDWGTPMSEPARVLATRSAHVTEGETTRVVIDLQP